MVGQIIPSRQIYYLFFIDWKYHFICRKICFSCATYSHFQGTKQISLKDVKMRTMLTERWTLTEGQNYGSLELPKEK